MKNDRKTKKQLGDELKSAQRMVARLKQKAERAVNGSMVDVLFATSPLLIAYLDTQFNFIRVNEAYARAAGRTPDYFIGKNHFVLYPDAVTDKIFHQVASTGIACRASAHPFRYGRDPEHGMTSWNWTLEPIKDARGTVSGLLLMLVNMTVSRRTEDELYLFRNLVDASSDALYIVDAEAGKFVDFNQRACETLGYSRAELLTLGFKDVQESVPDDAAWRSLQVEIAERGAMTVIGKHRRKDGSAFPVEVLIRRVVTGGNTYYVSTARDISERKDKERSLQAPEEKFRSIYNSASDGIIIADPRSKRFLSMNVSMIRMLGISPDDVPDLSVADIHPAEALPYVASAFEQCARNEANYFDNIPMLRKDGSVFIAEVSASWIRLEDANYLVGFFRDVTKRRLAEHAIRASEENLQKIIDGSAAVIFAKDLEGRYLFVNAQYMKLFHVTTSDILGKTDYDIFPADVAKAFQKTDAKALHAEKPIETEEAVPQDDGIHNYISLKFPLHDKAGKPYAVCGIATDITERRRAEEEIRQAKEFSEKLLRTANVIVLVLNIRGAVLQLNETGEITTGYRQEEIIGRSWFEKVVPRDRYPAVWEEFLRLTERKVSVSAFINPIVTKSGEERIISWQNSTLTADGGVVTVSFGIDITEKVGAEEALRKSEERLREAQQVAHIGNWELDLAQNRLYWSDEIFRIFEVDQERFKASYEGFLCFVHPDDREMVHRAYQDSVRDRTPYFIVHRLLTRDGRIKHVQEIGETSYDIDGRALRSFGTIQDITERNAIEDQLLVSLREKETLLKEVHHRVKNNLQIIASLLYFQSKKVTEPSSLVVLDEARDRLRSMILVHEKLYRSKDLTRVDIRDYVQTLLDQLRISYAKKIDNIVFQLEIAELRLPIEIALPVGMIINELITNIYKYAFPGDGKGDAFLGMDQTGGMLRIDISDSGIGTPAGIDLDQPTTFGLELVGNLVKQLNGSIEIERTPGTRYAISIPVSEDNHGGPA